MRKIFMYFRKIFFVFSKNCGMSGKFFWPPKWYTDQNFFGDGGREGGGGHPKKIFKSPFFFEKCPSEPAPPQLFEASYAPARGYVIYQFTEPRSAEVYKHISPRCLKTMYLFFALRGYVKWVRIEKILHEYCLRDVVFSHFLYCKDIAGEY